MGNTCECGCARIRGVVGSVGTTQADAGYRHLLEVTGILILKVCVGVGHGQQIAANPVVDQGDGGGCRAVVRLVGGRSRNSQGSRSDGGSGAGGGIDRVVAGI